MVIKASIFNHWVPKKLILPILILALFPHLMLLSMFSMNSTFTASFLDMEVDDLQFMFSMAYGLIVCGMFLHARFFHFFNIRAYLLIMTMLNIIVLFMMTLTTNKDLMLILRFIQGPLSLFDGSILLPLIMSRIQSKHTKIIAYSILYGYMLSSDKIATTIIKFAIENYNHNMIVYTIIGFHIFALLIYIFFFNHNRFFPKKPLYQLNLAGVILLVISLLSAAFFFIYGKKYNWFESEKIVISGAIWVIFSGLFLLHQLTSRRRLFEYGVLKSERVILGIILFFCFYIMRSSMSNIYQVMGTVWKWHWQYVLQIQYYNVAGTLMGLYFAYLMLTKNVIFKTIFMLGFFCMSCSMLWFSFLFNLDTTVENIAFPLFIEGLGQGILFTPIAFYMMGSVHPSITSTASQMGTATRFWGLTIGFSLMQNLVLELSTKHEIMMMNNLDITHPVFQQKWNSIFVTNNMFHLNNDAIRLSVSNMQGQLSQQALLLSNMEIFGALFTYGIVVLFGIIAYYPIKNVLFKAKSSAEY